MTVECADDPRGRRLEYLLLLREAFKCMRNYARELTNAAEAAAVCLDLVGEELVTREAVRALGRIVGNLKETADLSRVIRGEKSREESLQVLVDRRADEAIARRRERLGLQLAWGRLRARRRVVPSPLPAWLQGGSITASRGGPPSPLRRISASRRPVAAAPGSNRGAAGGATTAQAA